MEKHLREREYADYEMELTALIGGHISAVKETSGEKGARRVLRGSVLSWREIEGKVKERMREERKAL